MGIQVLDGAITALTVAKTSITGLGVPGVEPAINSVLQIATMVSTMKDNREGLIKLVEHLEALTAAIKTPAPSGELQNRLILLSSKFSALIADCQSIAGKSRFKRFLNGAKYQDKISTIKNSVASCVIEFTFYGNVSIEKMVIDIRSKVDLLQRRVGAVDQKLVTVDGKVDIIGEEVKTAAEENVFNKLKYVVAHYNAENTAEQCMDGTRVDFIKAIVEQLARLPDPSLRVVMLSGPTGSGKSTVAKTVASLLARDNLLAGSFFFSRDYADRKEIRGLPGTLAHQLAKYSPDFQEILLERLNASDEPANDEPRMQFRKLFVELLSRMPSSLTPWVICLDALDECGTDRGKVLLRWLSENIEIIPAHVRFFLTGRPDVPSYVKFDRLQPLMHKYNMNKIARDTVRQDIRLYVGQSLVDESWDRPSGWRVSDRDADEITRLAGELFVFAATAVRYIRAGSPRTHPQKSVDHLLRGASLNELNDLYFRIVNEAIPTPIDERDQEHFERAKRVLGAIVHLIEPQDAESLAGLLRMDQQELKGALIGLSSVVRVPESAGVIQIVHLSFREFITGKITDKRPDLLCGTEEQQRSLALDTLQAMQSNLKFNICDFPTSHLLNEDIIDLDDRNKKHIPGYVAYSCRFWSDHLAATRYTPHVAESAHRFVANDFLFWLEALSLLRAVSFATRALSNLIGWIGGDCPFAEFVRDGRRFISFFGDAIVQSAPHVYLSALALAPQCSKIAQHFRPRFPRLASIEIGQMEVWPATMLVLEKHTGGVTSVAVSSHGKRIVSGSEDQTIRVWDSESGELVAGPFSGHLNAVTSVAFSRDGKRIVSGSDDNTIRMWDSDSGEPLAQPFKGHAGIVTSVAFSCDGERIASGSEDATVRIWHSESGAPVAEPCIGHTKAVTSVAFSPDGERVVSGSCDETVRVWISASGEPVARPFEGHTNMVNSVAFSPDGNLIVSGADDGAVRVWDSRSGKPVAGPFNGHTDGVSSVAFSRDGQRIASGSWDSTVRMWSDSGESLTEPFNDHTRGVTSVAFSADDKSIVSGSVDKTIRVWASDGGAPSRGGTSVVSPWEEAVGGVGQRVTEPLNGHIKGVTSVGFSPDGKRIVSGSDDETVRVWNSESGEPVAGPFKGHTKGVTSVTFSRDGTHVVSGSWDGTVRVWDSETGEPVAEPFIGQTAGVTSVAFSQDGKRVVTGSNDGAFRVWNWRSGEAVVGAFMGHIGIHSVAFSPDCKRVVSGSSDATLSVWDSDSGDIVVGPFNGHSGGVTSVAFSPDGKRIVSGSRDETIRVWDSETGELAVGPFNGHGSGVTSVSFSPDGRCIISGSWDETIRVWDSESGEMVAGPFDGHTGGVTSVAFSPDGRRIVSGSWDRTIRVWGLESGPVVGISRTYRDNGWVSASSDKLIWLPRVLRSGLWSPQNTLVIGNPQTRLVFDHFAHGTDWAKCYSGA